ncbi:MAG: OmpA family protein, partial [Spirochaetales bacterium]|nr:OmpA family protein [Spirochaetales bacterium]
MKLRLLSLVFIFAAAFSLRAEQFRFSHTAGDQYRIVTSVEEDVFINGMYSHSADILNRVAVEVLDDREGSGLIRAVFQVSERASGVTTAYQWSEEYVSEFWRSPLGFYDIDRQYIMPTVRHVPAFPERSLAPGDRWTSEAEEVHDFSANFLMTEPLRFPVMVSYIYEKDEEINGQDMAVIGIQYSVFHRTGYPLTGLAQDLKPV